MQDITVDPLDPDLDLTRYHPEDLIYAKVKGDRIANGKFSVIPPERRDQVEAEILALLNDGQRERRYRHLERQRRSNVAAAKKLLESMRNDMDQVKADTEWLAKQKPFNLSGLGVTAQVIADPLHDQTEQSKLDAEEDAESPASTEVETLLPELKTMSAELVQHRHVLDNMAEILSKQLTEQEGTNQQLETQIKDSKESARNATRWALTSTIIAVLSLITASIALFRPVAIDQPNNQPVPVQIIEPEAPAEEPDKQPAKEQPPENGKGKKAEPDK